MARANCPGAGAPVFADATRDSDVPSRTRCSHCDRDDVIVLGTYVGLQKSPSAWTYRLRAHIERWD